MAKDMKVGCARPTGGPVGGTATDDPKTTPPSQPKKEGGAMIMVGQKAPDFNAPGYHNGKFISLSLSEYIGQWVLLCFYPGDFTFV